MSKRVVKKKVQEAPAAPAPTKAPPVPALPSAAVNDVRVAQQMRVMEVVGATGGAEKESKKYSPRTEKQIVALLPVLDHYDYSRAAVAALVARCHHNDLEIQLAVSNIIEDRANHASDSWGEVKSKKQLKEEKKLKEEEEALEQERMERELAKQRKDEERRAAREARQNKHGGASLPADPAILFAGAKPKGGEGDEEWWGSNWASGDWEKGQDGAHANGKDANWESGNKWDWQNGSWPEDEWAEGAGSGSKGGADWWEGEWEKAEKRGKRGAKEKGEGKGGGKKKNEPKADPGDMWDMPDAAVDAGSTLDMFTMGDIRAHERLVESAGGGEILSGMQTKAPESTMRTVEEIEREQFGGGSSGNGMPAGLPPAGVKTRIDQLLQDGAPERGEGKGKKGEKGEGGKGKGKGKKGDKGDKGEKGDHEKGDRGKERREREPRQTVAEQEMVTDENGDKVPLERVDRSDDPRRQAIEEVGEHVTVKKHSSMGCAVISLREPRVREAILADLGEKATISGIPVQLKRHFDKASGNEMMTDIFAAWGRQAEKTNPLPERDILKFFEAKTLELLDGWRNNDEAKARQADHERQAKLIQEQQSQVAEQRAREEQRRRFEEDLARRREEDMLRSGQQAQMNAQDAQRKAMEEAQRRTEEAYRIQRESKAKYINDMQGSWAAQ